MSDPVKGPHQKGSQSPPSTPISRPHHLPRVHHASPYTPMSSPSSIESFDQRTHHPTTDRNHLVHHHDYLHHQLESLDKLSLCYIHPSKPHHPMFLMPAPESPTPSPHPFPSSTTSPPPPPPAPSDHSRPHFNFDERVHPLSPLSPPPSLLHHHPHYFNHRHHQQGSSSLPIPQYIPSTQISSSPIPPKPDAPSSPPTTSSRSVESKGHFRHHSRSSSRVAFRGASPNGHRRRSSNHVTPYSPPPLPPPPPDPGFISHPPTRLSPPFIRPEGRINALSISTDTIEEVKTPQVHQGDGHAKGRGNHIKDTTKQERRKQGKHHHHNLSQLSESTEHKSSPVDQLDEEGIITLTPSPLTIAKKASTRKSSTKSIIRIPVSVEIHTPSVPSLSKSSFGESGSICRVSSSSPKPTTSPHPLTTVTLMSPSPDVIELMADGDSIPTSIINPNCSNTMTTTTTNGNSMSIFTVMSSCSGKVKGGIVPSSSMAQHHPPSALMTSGGKLLPPCTLSRDLSSSGMNLETIDEEVKERRSSRPRSKRGTQKHVRIEMDLIGSTMGDSDTDNVTHKSVNTKIEGQSFHESGFTTSDQSSPQKKKGITCPTGDGKEMRGKEVILAAFVAQAPPPLLLSSSTGLMHSHSHTNLQDPESGHHDLTRNHDRRRRSSLMSLSERVFGKSRIGPSASSSTTAISGHVSHQGRPSIASRLSFSSDHDLRVTNFNRLTDLRKMLNQEEEKEDWLTEMWHRMNSCECFEWNLNNAAKLITLGVFLVTFILVIRSLVNLNHH